MTDKILSGAKILSISKDGNEDRFTSTKGMAIENVASLLRGKPGSEVAVRAILKGEDDKETEEVFRLSRAKVLTFKLPDGKILTAFYNPDLSWSLLNLNAEDVKKLQHISFSKWSQITNGMASKDVVKAIGWPLRVEIDRQPGESMWQYGWLLYVDGKAHKPNTTELFITNGFVVKAFGIKQPPGGLHKIEVLSKFAETKE